MKRAMNTIACIGLVASLSAGVQAATLISLSEVISKHMTLMSGDKAFSGFQFLSQDFTQSDVIVLYGNDVVDKQGNYGICFEGDFTSENGKGSEVIKDLGLIFDVTATKPGRLITDAHLSITGFADGANSRVDVSETVEPAFGAALGLHAFIKGNGSYQLTDSGFLDVPSVSVRVLKDIRIASGKSLGDISSVSLICQYFSQSGAVPEPGSVALLVGMGVSGSLLFMRRRKK